MELLLPHTQNLKLEPGDYNDLMKALKKVGAAKVMVDTGKGHMQWLLHHLWAHISLILPL